MPLQNLVHLSYPSYSISCFQNRQRRQDYRPEYDENAGVEYIPGSYDYVYDPNLEITTSNSNENVERIEQSGKRAETSDGIINPMTEDEMAFLQEQYR